MFIFALRVHRFAVINFVDPIRVHLSCVDYSASRFDGVTSIIVPLLRRSALRLAGMGIDDFSSCSIHCIRQDLLTFMPPSCRICYMITYRVFIEGTKISYDLSRFRAFTDECNDAELAPRKSYSSTTINT